MGAKSLLIQGCKECLSRKVSLFCNMTDEDLGLFDTIRTFYVYEKNQTIFHEGTPCHGLYILCCGKVKLTLLSRLGQSQLLELVSPGEIIEKNGLFNMGVHSVTAETIERTQVGFIEKNDLLTILKENGDVAVKMINVLSQEVGRIQDQLNKFISQTARERLADLLLDLSEKYGVRNREGISLQIELKRAELAEMTGVSLETLIRLLKVFKDEKIIQTHGKEITLLETEKLSRICHQSSPATR